MSAYSDTLKELDLDEPVEKETTVETQEPVETKSEPSEKSEHVEETSKEPEKSEPVEKEPEDKPEPKPKPDYASLTKEDKAEYAFTKQLAKQRAKHDEEIKAYKEKFDSIQKQIEELKQSKQKPEEPKTRQDFENDDDYISYLSNKQVKEALAAEKEKRLAAEAEEAKRKQEEETAKAEQAERGRVFEENCRNAFSDAEQFATFNKRVEKAVANGLAEVLDKSPVVSKFVFTRPEGPKVLDKLLADRDTFVSVFKEQDPIMQTIALMNLAKEPATVVENQVPQVESPMPKIGKPGSRSGSSDDSSIFSSDESLIKFVRKSHGRRF